MLGQGHYAKSNDDDAACFKRLARVDEMIEIKVVSFRELLKREPIWDLIHYRCSRNRT